MPPSSEPALRLDFVQPGIARITFDQPGSRANTLSQGRMAPSKWPKSTLAAGPSSLARSDQPGLGGFAMLGSSDGLTPSTGSQVKAIPVKPETKCLWQVDPLMPHPVARRDLRRRRGWRRSSASS